MSWEIIRSMPSTAEPVRWRNGPFSRSIQTRPTVISKTISREAEIVFEVRLPSGRRHEFGSLEEAMTYAERPR